MKHTKEPWVGMVKGRFNSNHYWHADNDNSSCSTAAPIFAGGEVVCLAVSTDYEMQELEANAQRIVDCVNACSGKENPQAEITSLREQLEKAKKDGDRWRYLVDNKANIVTVENEKRGYRSTMPNAVWERWYEFEGYMISTSTTNETFKTYDEAIDSAMKGNS